MRFLRFLSIFLAFTSVSAMALVPAEHRDLHEFEFRHAELWWLSIYQQLDELPSEWTTSARTDLDVLGMDHQHAFLDVRTGRWGTLILTRPMIPGTGIGNELRWSQFAGQPPRDHYQLLESAQSAFLRFLADHEDQLGFAASEMAPPRLQIHGERHIQVHIGRQIDGIPVRDSYITANINSGNLILMGQRNWAETDLDTRPSISIEVAQGVLNAHLGELQPDAFRHAPKLAVVPVSGQPDHMQVTGVGEGLDYRLVWVLSPVFRDDIGTWEALVDAHNGELLAFEDTNHYSSEGDGHASLGGPSRGVVGGVYPVSNDGTPPDGIEYPGFPMPFANVSLDGSPIGFTTTGGNSPTSAAGTLATTLAGQFARISDSCGAVNESSSSGDLDMGDGAGTDCAVPPGSSGGNTSSSRTTYYGLNRIIEQAQGYLPTNNWLTNQLLSNMNINSNCNAFWNGSVNFYTSGGGCGNTGEIMAVVHHEWGHGMDANSVNPGISRPGEGIADIYAQNMLNDSCVGRGFMPGQNCGGFGDPCLECTGVRESDWALQQSGQPHDIAWILSACPSGSNTPCGRATHCEGSIVAEALWDLVHRDLQGFAGSPFNFDLNTALELGTRLTYEGSGAVGNWYQCNTSTGGCNADGGYLQYLAADADDGSIENGTPHMSAIFAAFDRHQLACSTPTVQNAGCESGPAEVPANLSATTFNEGVQLSWDPVADATEYWVYRTEGPMGCDFGKARVGQVSDTSFTEIGLRNNFDVYYSVIAVGAGGACTGPMSSCVTATPMQGPSGTLQGTIVRGGSASPLGDVLVEAVGDVTFSTMTDQDGNYSMTVLEGEYDVTASKAGFESASELEIQIVEDGTTVVDLVLDAPQVDAWPPLVELTVAQGGNGQSSLAIDNVGTLDLAWSLFSDEIVLGNVLLDGHEPDRDEPLTLSDFTLPGGGSSSETVDAGIESRGQVIGFTFEGTVSGISGNATWASDLALTLTGPDGSSYSVGGFQTGNPPWDFDGSGSSNDGTYTSTHIGADIFGDDGALDEGEWSFDFQHTWNNTMNWSAVTVTLHKIAPPVCQDPTKVEWLSTDPESGTVSAGDGDSVDVLVDATNLSEGQHEASLCLLTNDPSNALLVIPVSVEVVEPASLATIAGTVTSPGLCSGDPFAIAGAEILIEGAMNSYWTFTDANGNFNIEVPTDESPVTVTVSAGEHFGDQATDVILTGGETTIVDFELEPEVACIGLQPVSLNASLIQEETQSFELLVSNSGNLLLDWEITDLDRLELPDCTIPEWLDLNPVSGSVAADASGVIDVTFDASGLMPGTYEGQFCIYSNDPLEQGIRQVPVSLEVASNEATIEGTVTSLGYCTDNPAPAAGAEVLIEGQGESWTAVADGDGSYRIDVLVAESPFEVTAMYEGHLSDTESGISLEAGGAIELDFDLVLEAACAVVDPDTLEATVITGESGEIQLVVGNINGAAELSWSIALSGEPDTCQAPAQPAWLAVDPAAGTTAVGETTVVSLLADSAGLEAGEYGAWLCLTTNDEENPEIDVALLLKVLGIELFRDAFEPAVDAEQVIE